MVDARALRFGPSWREVLVKGDGDSSLVFRWVTLGKHSTVVCVGRFSKTFTSEASDPLSDNGPVQEGTSDVGKVWVLETRTRLPLAGLGRHH